MVSSVEILPLKLPLLPVDWIAIKQVSSAKVLTAQFDENTTEITKNLMQNKIVINATVLF